MGRPFTPGRKIRCFIDPGSAERENAIYRSLSSAII